MQSLEKKLQEYINILDTHEKSKRVASEPNLDEKQFKQRLYEQAASEREASEKCATIFNELLPILKELKNSPEYVSDNVEALTKFANAVSGLHIYFDPANPNPADRYTAILVYRALLDNAMKDPAKTEAQVIYTRNLSMCLSHTVGFTLSREAIAYLDRLFEKIPLHDCAKLSDTARKAYPYCKFVWMVNYYNDIDRDFETLETVLDEMKSFMHDAKKHIPEYDWDSWEQQLAMPRIVLGTRCEFGGAIAMSAGAAQKQLTFMQQGMNPEAWAAFAPENNFINDDMRISFLRNHTLQDHNDTFHLAWAELAHRCNLIDSTEYYKFLLELAQKFMAKPTTASDINILMTLIQTGLSAVAVLCKYYPSMNAAQKRICDETAKQCLTWLKSFPTRGRMVLGSLGNELNTVCNIAFMGLSKREKATSLLRLTTESTYAHSVLCAEMAVDFAHTLCETFPDLTNEQIADEIYVGALLHDIGKLEVSGPISQAIRDVFDEEFVQIKTHPTRALRYLAASEFTCARACAIWHHIHFDGKGGYPLNYKDSEAERFRPIAQLIAFVDRYTSALDRYLSEYQAQKKPADIVRELTAKSDRLYHNPVFLEELTGNPSLLAKYTNEDYVVNWIEKCYYDAYVAFQG